MGWYFRNIKIVLKRDNAKDLIVLIQKAKKLHMRNPGSYLFKILMNWGPKHDFVANLANKTIEELQNEDDDGDVADAFQQAAKTLSVDEFVYFANCIRNSIANAGGLGERGLWREILSPGLLLGAMCLALPIG